MNPLTMALSFSALRFLHSLIVRVLLILLILLLTFTHLSFFYYYPALPESSASSSTAALADEESADEPESSEAAVVASSSMPGWGDETNEPDEGTWITAENVNSAHDLEEVENAAPATLVDVSAVAVITTDFAMQNVLLQMGLRLLSVNGIAVRTLRSSIKRCYGCYRIERNMEKEFCQHCGGHTLVRVAITVDANGNLKWKQSNRQVFWKRGTVYSIPKPKRGEIPMLLREDQLQVGRMRQLQNNKKRAERQAARAMFGEEANMGRGGRGRAAAAPATKSLMEASAFAAEKVVSRAEDIQFGYGRRNPNVNGRKKK
jgi:rRNA maturation endonuclease Nob1